MEIAFIVSKVVERKHDQVMEFDLSFASVSCECESALALLFVISYFDLMISICSREQESAQVVLSTISE